MGFVELSLKFLWLFVFYNYKHKNGQDDFSLVVSMSDKIEEERHVVNSQRHNVRTGYNARIHRHAKMDRV